jgi:hypothetical protein
MLKSRGLAQHKPEITPANIPKKSAKIISISILLESFNN